MHWVLCKCILFFMHECDSSILTLILHLYSDSLSLLYEITARGMCVFTLLFYAFPEAAAWPRLEYTKQSTKNIKLTGCSREKNVLTRSKAHKNHPNLQCKKLLALVFCFSNKSELLSISDCINKIKYLKTTGYPESKWICKSGRVNGKIKKQV